MNGTRAFLTTSGILFALIGVLHMCRVVLSWTVQIGPWDVPMWASWAALFAAGGLATWAFALTNDGTRPEQRPRGDTRLQQESFGPS